MAEPKTREEWIDLNWGTTPPVPWTADREMEIPEELQDWSWIDDPVDVENDYPELPGEMIGTAIPKQSKRDAANDMSWTSPPFKKPAQDRALARAWSVPVYRKRVPRVQEMLLAMDRNFRPLASEIGQPIAMDRSPSARQFSEDGHLHIDNNRISKATVNPYWGREIPKYEKFGLDADKKYMLLRDPRELAKAARTFNNKPILADHIPVTSAEHPSNLVIGATGSDTRYEHPYLKSSLVFWPQPAIDAIQSEGQKELSCAYHYDFDPTPGVYEGQRYDGVMRNIRGNHVALVRDGRAGSDVVVQDAAFREEV